MRFGMGGRGFDEIAQHVVVLDLQRGDARLGNVIGLHGGDDAAAFVAQLAGFIQFGVITRCDETAITGQQRRFGDKRVVQQVNQRVMP